jgi:hypothetical protein
MDAEISQLIAVALSLSDSTVSERIQGVGKNQIAEFKLQEWDMKVQTNSVAAHFDDCLIVDPTASTPTGKIYEHYKNWCDSNLKAVSHIKYPKMLSELCNDYLELSSVKWIRSGGRSWFEGLRFRTPGETLPTHSDSLSALIPQNLPTDTGCKTELNGVETGLGRDSESLPDGNYSHLRGLEVQNIAENLESSSSLTEESQGTSHHFCEKLESSSGLIEESQITSHESKIIEKVGLNPINPVEIPEPLPDGNLSQPTNSVPSPCEPLYTPHSSDESAPQSVAASNESTADQVAITESELVQKLQARILQAIADKNPAAANDVYCQVHELGVKEAVKAVLTDIENENFRRLVKLWKQTKTQP